MLRDACNTQVILEYGDGIENGDSLGKGFRWPVSIECSTN